ncbi:hypothetical protein EPR50_G00153550 [Perca flavescens]|uniref:Uncharacterized protein n=1 Tax=Perca flavescens TaxID=8167 RepID=A0A484CKU0_PERFV|nr:hypothetical protein EPR50_G00153550 [Perca flavescens]
MWEIVAMNWREFLPLFTNATQKLSRNDIRKLFTISWSPQRTGGGDGLWECWLMSIQAEEEMDISFEELLHRTHRLGAFRRAEQECTTAGNREQGTTAFLVHADTPEQGGARESWWVSGFLPEFPPSPSMRSLLPVRPRCVMRTGVGEELTSCCQGVTVSPAALSGRQTSRC